MIDVAVTLAVFEGAVRDYYSEIYRTKTLEANQRV